MIRIFFPSQKTPDWLQKVEPAGALKFDGLALVYAKAGNYHVRNIVGFRSVFRIDDIHQDVSISGQAPGGGSGGVFIDCRPMITINTLVAITITMLVAYAY